MTNEFKKVRDAWKKHERLWHSSLNLIASENAPSAFVSELLSSDFGNRVAEGPIGNRIFPGVKYYEEIEEIGVTVCKELFDCEEVELRPISGTIANLAIYCALVPRHGRILTLSLNSGGHVSMTGKLPQHFEYVIEHIPFHAAEMNINVSEGLKMISALKPDMLLLGGSVILFPQPVRELAKATKSNGGIVVFDGAHVAGLIAGKCFPNPLKEGADLLAFTTCKTIPGPQHAFVVGRRDLMKRVSKSVSMLHSGHHLHATASAVLSCVEMQNFGCDYANQIIRNARALGRALAELKIPVLHRSDGQHTATHTLLIEVTRWENGANAEEILAKAGIFVNRNLLYSDDPKNFRTPSGIRLGTAEITRWGMTEKEMWLVADLIARALNGEKASEINKRVRKLRNSFQELHYCFK